MVLNKIGKWTTTCKFGKRGCGKNNGILCLNDFRYKLIFVLFIFVSLIDSIYQEPIDQKKKGEIL